jgi:exonuclease SbcD
VGGGNPGRLQVIRLAHISDTHFCDQRRPQDLARVLDAFIEQAADEKVNAIVHAGDFFDRRSTPADRIALASFLMSASDIAPVFGVKGNHDIAGDLSLFNMLQTDSPIVIVDRPTRPGTSTRMGPFAMLALPWFDKAHLVAGLDAVVDTETTRRATIETAEDLLIGFRTEAASVRNAGLIPIFVSHAMVQGSVMSTGQVIQGTTVELSPYAIQEIGAEYAALGHVHKTQEWMDGRVAYSGSPIRHNFGEPEQKGWRLVTFDDAGKFVSNEFRELPARAIVLLEADFTTGDTADVLGTDTSALSLAGALVRLRYKVRSQDLGSIDEGALRKLLEEAGAADVKLEVVVEHQAHVRSASIAEARTTQEKVASYFEAKGEVLPPATVERLNEKLDEIEREASGA